MEATKTVSLTEHDAQCLMSAALDTARTERNSGYYANSIATLDAAQHLLPALPEVHQESYRTLLENSRAVSVSGAAKDRIQYLVPYCALCDQQAVMQVDDGRWLCGSCASQEAGA